MSNIAAISLWKSRIVPDVRTLDKACFDCFCLIDLTQVLEEDTTPKYSGIVTFHYPVIFGVLLPNSSPDQTMNVFSSC